MGALFLRLRTARVSEVSPLEIDVDYGVIGSPHLVVELRRCQLRALRCHTPKISVSITQLKKSRLHEAKRTRVESTDSQISFHERMAPEAIAILRPVMGTVVVDFGSVGSSCEKRSAMESRHGQMSLECG